MDKKELAFYVSVAQEIVDTVKEMDNFVLGKESAINFAKALIAMSGQIEKAPVIQLWKDGEGEWKGQEDKKGRVFGSTHQAKIVDIEEL